MRRALVSAPPLTVAAYLPSNYKVVDTIDDRVVIEGEDAAGWTLHDYVIPRLASGLIHAVESAKVKLRIENTYEDDETIVTWPVLEVKLPVPDEDDDARDDWEYTQIHDHTGVSNLEGMDDHTSGDSWHDVEIVESTVPELVGMTFDFGY